MIACFCCLGNFPSTKSRENNKVTFLSLKEKRKKSKWLHWKVREGINRGCESDFKVDSPNCVTPKIVLLRRLGNACLTRVHVTVEAFPSWIRFFSASHVPCRHANLMSKCLQKPPDAPPPATACFRRTSAHHKKYFKNYWQRVISDKTFQLSELELL